MIPGPLMGAAPQVRGAKTRQGAGGCQSATGRAKRGGRSHAEPFWFRSISRPRLDGITRRSGLGRQAIRIALSRYEGAPRTLCRVAAWAGIALQPFRTWARRVSAAGRHPLAAIIA
jgi:hypothetical protein